MSLNVPVFDQKSERIVISVDAMGGANAPHSVIEAVSIVCSKRSDVDFILCGSHEKLSPILEANNIDQSRYTIEEASTVIMDDDKPINALRCGISSSMRKCIDTVNEKRASACISAGNTGALMVIAKVVLGTMHGIERPAIAGIVPGLNSDGEWCQSIMLDMGANTACTEQMLVQFGCMGACLATVFFSKEKPKVALLNIGVEQSKGRELEQKAYEALKQSGLNFIGYLEGHDLTKGVADVLITDGFSGNLVLKTLEGAAQMFGSLLRKSFSSTLMDKLRGFVAAPALKRQIVALHPDNNNGGMMVGLNGIVVKAHGSSNSQAFVQAIYRTISLVEQDINGKISNLLPSIVDGQSGMNMLEKIKSKIFG